MQPARSGLCGLVWLRHSHTCTHPQSVTATQTRIQRSHKSADIFFFQYPHVQRSRGAALYVKQLKSNAYMWHCKYKQEEEKWPRSAHTPEAVYIKHWARLTGPVCWFCLFSKILLSFHICFFFVSTFMLESLLHIYGYHSHLYSSFLLPRCVCLLAITS